MTSSNAQASSFGEYNTGISLGDAFPTAEELKLAQVTRSSLEQKDMFVPFTYPLPNMIILPECLVKFKNLTSVSGQELNGKIGKAKHFFLDTARWSVEVDGKTISCRIQNLERAKCEEESKLNVLFFGSAHANGGGKAEDLVIAGCINGKLAVVITDSPERPGYDSHAVKAQCLIMGVPPSIIANLEACMLSTE